MPLTKFVPAAMNYVQLVSERIGDSELWLWDGIELHWLVRVLKMNPSLAVKENDEAFRSVERAFKSGSRSSSWVFDLLDTADGYAEFLNLWDQIRFPPMVDPVKMAHAMARKCKLNLEKDRGSVDYKLFVSTAAWLQVLRGDADILLPTHGTLCDLFGVKPKTISIWIKWAQREGLKKTRKYTGGPNRPADEFRFDITRWEGLCDRAPEAFTEALSRPEQVIEIAGPLSELEQPEPSSCERIVEIDDAVMRRCHLHVIGEQPSQEMANKIAAIDPFEGECDLSDTVRNRILDRHAEWRAKWTSKRTDLEHSAREFGYHLKQNGEGQWRVENATA